MNRINVKNLLDISAALSKEKDYNKLLSRILKEAMDMTHCDGGTLYLLSGGSLRFKIMVTHSLGYCKGVTGEPIDLPPVALEKSNVCACAAIEKRIINVADVYLCSEYDFSGPRNYDTITGYTTKSMLVVPMQSHEGDIIGVLQLLNAMDCHKAVVPFSSDYENAIESLASLAAVSITNMNHIEEIKGLFESFVSVVSTAIDERSPYNANHTKNMARYGQNFIAYVNRLYKEGKTGYFFTENSASQLILSIWLHDIGKLVTPLSVMNKETRLGRYYEPLMQKLEKIMLLNKIRLLEGEVSEAEYNAEKKAAEDAAALIKRVNAWGYLDEELYREVLKLARKSYKENGETKPWLSEYEMSLLTIRKGTLNDVERGIMENHVVITRKLLSRINFPSSYSHVLEWASAHHELIDGSGYPDGLKESDIPFEVRVLTVLDIFDALTARDGPYKPPMPVEGALLVLWEMADEGKLDMDIVRLFKDSRSWEQKEA